MRNAECGIKPSKSQLRTLILRPRDFDRCHSEKRSDEESRFGRDAERFFASAMLRLRMTYSSASAVARMKSGEPLHPSPGFRSALSRLLCWLPKPKPHAYSLYLSFIC